MLDKFALRRSYPIIFSVSGSCVHGDYKYLIISCLLLFLISPFASTSSEMLLVSEYVTNGQMGSEKATEDVVIKKHFSREKGSVDLFSLIGILSEEPSPSS